jgi:SAM-dependent methyltransferase
MVKRIIRVIKRERVKYPGKGILSLLVKRFLEICSEKSKNWMMSLKKDSTFKSVDALWMCSLFPKNVLDIVIADLHPKSVLDVGCGVGKSLEYFFIHHIDAWGNENSAVAIQNSPVKERIIKHNLKKELNLKKKFDLVWCFEVIEHIHPDFENAFLNTLMNHSNNILISAAIPGQGGHGHFNEKEPGYWISKFENHGYQYDDDFTLKVRATLDNHSENLLFFSLV